MGRVVADISMSLDGYIAGPKPTLKEPLGQGGEQLHEWAFKLKAMREPHGMKGGATGPENDYFKEAWVREGAIIMGRKMFSGGKGSWEKDPRAYGWWGDDPPFHVPVFVLTHHQREKLNMKGGTSFTFVTDGIKSALSQAKKAAGDKDVAIGGGASAIQQFIEAGLLDELHIHLVPVLLKGGTLLLENLGNAKLKKVKVVDFPLVTHLHFQPKK